MNYITIHQPSQLIKTVVTSSLPPTPDGDHAFYAASEIVLTKYYKLKSKANRQGVLVSVGDLAAASPSFLESLRR
ncbi:hypothetical protein [Pseudomonas sp. NFACC25]|uniref:hypothetical protein n=1 Tax=Pseudomonas sp. NFACC25 TaxID=1566188 RepID=UPI001113A248|nr:hypothetical protein [Pseudomonas sp. NFACC25]